MNAIAELCDGLGEGIDAVEVTAYHVPSEPEHLDGPVPPYGPCNAYLVMAWRHPRPGDLQTYAHRMLVSRFQFEDAPMMRGVGRTLAEAIAAHAAGWDPWEA